MTKEQAISHLMEFIGDVKQFNQEAYNQLGDGYNYPSPELAEAALMDLRMRRLEDLPVEDCGDMAADLEEWRSYWGSDSPHDSHICIGTSEPYARQLGVEQARANRAVNALAEANERLRVAKQVLERIVTTERGRHLASDATNLIRLAAEALAKIQEG